MLPSVGPSCAKVVIKTTSDCPGCGAAAAVPSLRTKGAGDRANVAEVIAASFSRQFEYEGAEDHGPDPSKERHAGRLWLATREPQPICICDRLAPATVA